MGEIDGATAKSDAASGEGTRQGSGISTSYQDELLGQPGLGEVKAAFALGRDGYGMPKVILTGRKRMFRILVRIDPLQRDAEPLGGKVEGFETRPINGAIGADFSDAGHPQKGNAEGLRRRMIAKIFE